MVVISLEKKIIRLMERYRKNAEYYTICLGWHFFQFFCTIVFFIITLLLKNNICSIMLLLLLVYDTFFFKRVYFSIKSKVILNKLKYIKVEKLYLKYKKSNLSEDSKNKIKMQLMSE